MKVLVIDDAPELIEAISLCFEIRWPSSTIVSAQTGEEGIRLLQEIEPDVVILDKGLPSKDGFQVCRDIRSFSNVPLIMLAARSDDRDIVKGLEWGADDYIAKPFSYIEFLARVQAVIRRSLVYGLHTSDQPYATKELSVWSNSHEIEVRGVPVRLTNIEFNLLFHLIKNSGKPMSTNVLLTKVWGPQYGDTPPEQDIRLDPNDPDTVLLVPVGGHQAKSKRYLLKVHIQHLRQKIERHPGKPAMIRTERGIGYKFVP